MIQVSDFPALTDDLQSIFDEVAARKIADNVGFSVFDVFDTDRRTYDHLILHGVAGIKRVTPGQDLPKVNSEEGKIIAFVKSFLINGENLRRKAMATLSKLIEKIKNSILQLQRLSGETSNLEEATVRTIWKHIELNRNVLTVL